MEQTADEIRHLQGCINDLISVLAIPALRRGQESAQIVSTLLDVLVGMLRLDFAYARLKDPVGGAPIEMVRLAQSRNLTARPQEIGEVLNSWLGDDPQKWPLLVRTPIGDGDVSIVPLLVHGAIEVAPLTFHANVGLIHPPAAPDGALAAVEGVFELGAVFPVVQEKSNISHPACRAGINRSFTRCCIRWRPRGSGCTGY
jgi:hypothetical protein